MASTQMYFYTQVMGSLFKDYEEVEQVTDFWDVSYFKKFSCLPFFEMVKETCVFTNFSKLLLFQFMEGSMLDGIYWEYLYNDGTDKRFVCLHFLGSICLHFIYISCMFNFLKGLYVLEEKKQWVPVL